MNTYWELGSAKWFTCITSFHPHKKEVISLSPFLWMRKSRSRENKPLVQHYTALKWRSWNLNPRLSVSATWAPNFTVLHNFSYEVLQTQPNTASVLCCIWSFFCSQVNFKLSLLNTREARSRAFIDRTTKSKAAWILTLFSGYIQSFIHSQNFPSTFNDVQKLYSSEDKTDDLCP